MKNLIVATGALMLMMNVNLIGEETPTRPTNENTYCAEMKDQELVVMRDGQVLTEDIVLENGTQIKTDGKVIYPNGLKASLKAGECVDKTGIITTPPKNEAKQ